MTFAELRTEVFRRLDEDSADPAFWTAADINTALNEAYEELSDSSEWHERNAILKLLSKRTYNDLRFALGSGEIVLTLKHAYNSTTRRWLDPVELRDLDYRTFHQWEDITGEPEKFFLRGLFWLGTFPKQNTDSGNLKLYYTAIPPAMSADTDEPGFPEEFQHGLIEYALGDLLAQEGETQKGLAHFREYLIYEAGLTGYAQGRISLDRISKLNG